MKKLATHFSILILVTSIILGSFFRINKLGDSPSGFYIDEASIGYNAYSVLKTGKDEFGKSFPIMFRSFSTFQSPVYTYITIPSIYFLGLSPFSVRLPSAIFGILTIPLLYLLVKQLVIPGSSNLKLLPSLSALFIAVSPWHILYSRTAYEANIALFFLLTGTLFLYKSLNKTWLYLLSATALAISMVAYRAEIVLVPIVFSSFIVTNYKNLKSKGGELLLPIISSFIIGVIILFPTLKIIQSPGFKARTSVLSIFSNKHQFPWGLVSVSGTTQKVVNNNTLITIREFSSLYSSYFSPRYIFSLGDAGPRKPYPDIASLFVWQFPFYLLGIYFLLKESKNKSLMYFVFTLFLASPIPAALTRDPYSTLRSLPMVIPLAIIVSFGVIQSWNLLIKVMNIWRLIVLFVAITYSVGRMYISIFYHHDYYRSEYWSYGWEEAAETIKKLNPNLPIVVDGLRGHPYIELLFFLKYDPEKYQNENYEVSPADYYTNIEHNEVKKIDNITVKNFRWGVDTDRVEKYLIVDSQAISDQQILEHNLTIISDILYPNKQVALRILKTNPPQ